MPAIPNVSNPGAEFHPPRTMDAAELGDHLARLVWESFSDMITDGEVEALLKELDIPLLEGVPDQRVTGELLIFLMWAHTRGVQQAFLGRTPETVLRNALDNFHKAVFEDLEAHGTDPAQLPIFEQRVGARYMEYHSAANESDVALGRTALAHLAMSPPSNATIVARLTERAVNMAGPLKDYLEDVELVD